MTQYQPPVSKKADDEIDLRELFKVIWQGKRVIIAVTFVFAVASVFYALSLPNIYKSEALLAPASEQKMSGLSGQLGGLAALAGVSLGSGSADNTALALEIIKSRDFIGRFIERHNILVDLMASEEWDMNSNTLIYSSAIYDVETQTWTRTVEPPFNSKPSIQEAHRVFLEKFSVMQDKDSGMILISIQHLSPYIAQQWLSWLIEDINQEMKIRDIKEAERSIVYLQKQIQETNISDVKAALFSLIEEQTKSLMLANVRDEYVLKVVDSPMVPEQRDSPKRALICLLITFLGSIFSVFFVLLVNMFRKDDE
ncbi:Wzz/FepE/Etk N-terminal domain-containing protein [Chromatiaceae bacterium AAb-1]|nr:Wzz/FepE/Etk N-terminal domain-containing protein [Chromatiaceae bacterium AAb-1]